MANPTVIESRPQQQQRAFRAYWEQLERLRNEGGENAVRDFIDQHAFDETAVEATRRAREFAAGREWRSTPATMAAHLTKGRYKRYHYIEYLATKFADAAEGRSTRQIWNLPGRRGKPVEEHTLVLMADGTRREIRDIVPGDEVITHLGRARRVLAVHEQGMLPVVRIQTRMGRSTIAALDHPFLTADGWVEAAKLQPWAARAWGHVLATVASPQLFLETDRSAAEFRMAGYFIGDGSVTRTGPSYACQITCADAVEQADIERCAAEFGWSMTAKPYQGKALRLSFRRGASGTGPRPWMVAADIAGGTSWSKRVPPWVFSAPNEMVAEFIGAYFACDGTFSRSDDREQVIEFYSVSRSLLQDVQHLLLRLGIPSALRGKKGLYKGQRHLSWRLRIIGKAGAARFVKNIPIHHQKGHRLAAADMHAQDFPSGLLPDPVVSVEPADDARCLCLSVEDDETFTADDLVVHNSYLGSQWGPAWCIDLTDGLARFILVSYGKDLAVENAVGIRSILEEHAAELSPGARLRPGRERMDRFETIAGGGVAAAGIDGRVTGFGAGNGGGLVLDDPFRNWQQAHSEARRDYIYNQFRGTLRNRLDQESAFIIVIHHRYHEDDITARLMADAAADRGDQWELVALPAIAMDNDPLGREPGEPLEAEMFTLDDEVARQRGLGSYLAAALEQQNPTPAEGNELLRSWFVLAESAELPSSADYAITSWDLKLKDREAGDYVVGQCWWRVGEASWLMDQLRGHYDHATTANAIALLQVRHPEVKRNIIELAGSADEVIPELKKAIPGYTVSDEMAARLGMNDAERIQVQQVRRSGMGNLHGEPVTDGSKSVRARAQIPGPAEAGNVRMPGDAPWVPAFLDEVAAFPNGANDDQVDTMSLGLKFIRRRRRMRGATAADL